MHLRSRCPRTSVQTVSFILLASCLLTSQAQSRNVQLSRPQLSRSVRSGARARLASITTPRLSSSTSRLAFPSPSTDSATLFERPAAGSHERGRRDTSNLAPKSSRSASITAQTFKVSEATMLQVMEDRRKPLEDYLKEVERIVELSFQDAKRRKRLDENTWQVQLLPQEFIGVRFAPVTTLKVFSDEDGLHITVSDLDLDLPPSMTISDPPVLEVFGTMKPSVRLPRGKTIIRGSVEMALTADIPPQFMMVPGVSSLIEAILRRILIQLKQSLESGISRDYGNWCEGQ